MGSIFWSGFHKRAAAMKEVACIAVFDDGTQQMLMGKRRDNLKWTNPGGHLDAGEAPRAGALRELQEETGILLSDKELSPVGSRVVTKPDGTKLKVYGFKAELTEKEKTTLRNDPDQEVSSWRWVPTKNGLPGYVATNLHVPLGKNILLDGLGIKAEQEKTAFWQGFASRIAGGVPDVQQLSPVAQEMVQNIAKDRLIGGTSHRKKSKSVKQGSAHRSSDDIVPGGLADQKTDKDFSAKALRQGVKVEMEHTNQKPLAKEIAKDHLVEDESYYDKLKKMESAK